MTTEPSSSGAFLEIRNLCKRFPSGQQKLTVLEDFSLTLNHAELLAIVGRSGSGKTTLLNLIAGLARADGGSILLEGRELIGLDDEDWVEVRQSDMGFVFQFNQLLPEFTALENVMLPGMLRSRDKQALESKAHDLLARMGMEHRASHRPTQLSGGERQRTAIARALINDPRLLLADEPTGSLDLESGQRVLELLFSLQKELKISCMLVTHNPALANLCDRIHQIESRSES